MKEFDFISSNFRALSGEGSYDLRNDGAIIPVLPGKEIVVSTDTMVENLHFLSNDPPKTIAKKLLRCNLSDLAAMGALPKGYTLNVSVPPNREFNDLWFKKFSEGLAEDQKAFNFSLLGGDTTGNKASLVLNVTIFGEVDKDHAIRRDQAKIGDDVWVTGIIGDAVLGLYARLGEINDISGRLTRAYQIPTPRVGMPLWGIVSSALDISDGILQDAGHIADESHVKIILERSLFPFSQDALAVGEKWEDIRTLGGDDYQLLMTVPQENREKLLQLSAIKNIPITRIGHVEKGEGVTILDENNHPLIFEKKGWQHF